MEDVTMRHATRMLDLIAAYRGGKVTLDAFIQRVEGIVEAAGIPRWQDDIFPIILQLEQLNAFAITTPRDLTPGEHMIILRALSQLVNVIEQG